MQRARAQRGYARGWLVLDPDAEPVAFASTHAQAIRLAATTARIRATIERNHSMPETPTALAVELDPTALRAVLDLAAGGIDARMTASQEFAAWAAHRRVSEALDAAELAR